MKRLLWVFWLVWLVVAAALCVHALLNGRLDADLLALLPDEDRRLLAGVNEGSQAQLLFLVRAADAEAAQSTADRFERLLDQSDDVTFDDPTRMTASVGRWLSDFRFQLLAAEDQRSLDAGHPEFILQRAWDSLAGPESFSRITPVKDDPLGLAQRFLTQQTAAFTLGEGDPHAVILSARLGASALHLGRQDTVIAAIDAAWTAASAGGDAQLLRAGVLFHSAANAAIARQGTYRASLLAFATVLLISLLAFKSVRPTLLVVVPIVAGCISGLAVGFWVFGDLHVLTLAFGTTLVGLAADYSIHFLCARSSGRKGTQIDRESDRTLAHTLRSPLLWSAGSTAIAYACLLVSGISLLMQVAVVAASGLLCAAATVLLFFPALCAGLVPNVSRAGPSWRPTRLVATGLLLVVGVVSASTLLLHGRFNTDPRALDGTPEGIRAETLKVTQAASAFDPGTVIVVSGNSEEDVLARAEALTPRLQSLQAQGAIDGFMSIAQWVPSHATQRANYQRLAPLFTPDARLDAFFNGIGAPELAGAERAAYHSHAEWLLRPDDDVFRQFFGGLLWLDNNGTHAAIIRLAHIHDAAAVRAAMDAVDGVGLVVIPAELQRTFATIVTHSAQWLIVAIAVTAMLLMALRRTVRILWGLGAVVAGGTTALAVLSALGDGLNMFHLLGCFLVLGVGIDYVVMHSFRDDAATTRSVRLSALTTLAAFGFLYLIEFPAIQALGATVFLGTLGALLLVETARPLFQTGAPPSEPPDAPPH